MVLPSKPPEHRSPRWLDVEPEPFFNIPLVRTREPIPPHERPVCLSEETRGTLERLTMINKASTNNRHFRSVAPWHFQRARMLALL